MRDAGLFLFLLFLLLLLVAFLYKIVTLPHELAVPTPPEPAPELVLPASLVGQAPPAPLPAGAVGRPGDAGYGARHIPSAVQWRPQPEASRRQPWGAVAASILAVVGLTVALAGGWLFSRADVGNGACQNRAAAVCSQGYVLFTDGQILGGVICLAGITIALAGLYLALRERPQQ